MAVEIDDSVYEPDALVRCGQPLDEDTVKMTEPLIVSQRTVCDEPMPEPADTCDCAPGHPSSRSHRATPTRLGDLAR